MKTPKEKPDTAPLAQSSRLADLEAIECAGDNGVPRLVIRGESLNTPHKTQQTSHPYSAHTDWLNVTFPLDDDRESINQFRILFSTVAGQQFYLMEDRGRGHLGFRQSFSMGKSGAVFAIGGQGGRAFLSLSGKSCTSIRLDSWGDIVSLLRDHYKARITRWDGAADDLDGEHDIDWAVEQYLSGGFTTGGNRPKSIQHGDWIERNGNGRTIEVGKKKNGKMLRIYEKGKEQGDPNSKWMRWELQLGKKDREIPWEVLFMPGQFVAGAYKCTSWISEKIERIKIHNKAKDISTEHLVECCKQSYGPLISELRQRLTPEQIVDRLARTGIMKKLDLIEPAD